MLELQGPLVDGGVGHVEALAVLQHARQVAVQVLHAVILVALHLVPVGKHCRSHFGKEGRVWGGAGGGGRNTLLYSECVGM